MNDQGHEKVGIVVVHGVGDTFAGWTDQYLVPRLERWRAFESIKQLDAKCESDDLTLILETALRFIVVSVDSDDHFHRFCDVTGLNYEDSPQFRTRAARIANRDELVAYASQVMQLVDASRWLESLRNAGVPAGIAFNPESEVNRVRDPESSDTTLTWQSFSRSWPLAGRDVVMTELFWADLSKVGTTGFTRFGAMLQLVMESPNILGRAFVSGGGGIHFIIRQLILFANWLMRRPIAGLNTAIFTAAFAMLAVANSLPKGADSQFWLAATIFVSLSATAIAGFYFYTKWANSRIGLADVALSTWIFSLILIAVAVALPHLVPKAAGLATSAPYLMIGLGILISLWFLWAFAILLGVLLVCLVLLKRAVFGRSERGADMARAGASITLSVLLGMLWKFVLAMLGVMIIGLVEPGSLKFVQSCGIDEKLSSGELVGVISRISEWIFKAKDQCVLAFGNVFLLLVAIINLLSLIAVLLAVAVVMIARRMMIWTHPKSALAGHLVLPRVIANWLIIVTAFVAVMLNQVLIGIDQVHEASLVVGNLLLPSIIGIGVALYFVFSWFIDFSGSFVHIGRDLVNHQFNRTGASILSLIEPDKTAFIEIDGKKQFKPFRRRLRIQRRLEALIDEVVGRQDVDRLILIGHSQGSVILYDYLANNDSLVGRDHLATDALADVKSIDILTLGSPLSHLYKYYFHEYAQRPFSKDATSLMFKAKSWVNLWRVDDPIGNRVDVMENITNIGLPPGGHVDYWREDQVCEIIWEMIWRGAEPGSLPLKVDPVTRA